MAQRTQKKINGEFNNKNSDAENKLKNRYRAFT
jgi:hypothetical protein